MYNESDRGRGGDGGRASAPKKKTSLAARFSIRWTSLEVSKMLASCHDDYRCWRRQRRVDVTCNETVSPVMMGQKRGGDVSDAEG